MQVQELDSLVRLGFIVPVRYSVLISTLGSDDRGTSKIPSRPASAASVKAIAKSVPSIERYWSDQRLPREDPLLRVDRRAKARPMPQVAAYHHVGPR